MLERVNLVPQLPLSERLRKATLPTAIILLVLAALFLMVDNKLLQSQFNGVDRKISIATKNSEAAATMQAHVAKLSQAVAAKREEIKRLGLRADQLGSLQTRKKHHSSVLAAIAQALPESIRCNKITFQDNGGLISGTALQYKELPGLIKALETDPIFSGVTLHDLDRSTEADKTEFNFTLSFGLR